VSLFVVTLVDFNQPTQTVSALGTFLLAMVQNPAIQTTAQRKIDEVLDGDRLPDFGDEKNLPYIHAIVKEVLRWQPVTPLGIIETCAFAKRELNFVFHSCSA
jgi:cytochrome P450